MNPPDYPLLLDLLAGRPSHIELDQAALEIAQVEYPDLDVVSYIRDLDRHAASIADRAGDLSDGEAFIRTTNEYLFSKLRLQGNNDDYYNPENSLLNRVLDTGLGIPISLCVIYLEIARRLAKPVTGISLPGHFIIQYDDGDYSTYIDPFHGGRLIGITDCCELAQVDSIENGMLETADHRSIVMRMINNLRNAYFSRKEPVKAERVLNLLIAANPDSPEEYKQLGVALLQQERMGDSARAFRHYLMLLPDAPDRDAVQEHIRNLTHWLASRN